MSLTHARIEVAKKRWSCKGQKSGTPSPHQSLTHRHSSPPPSTNLKNIRSTVDNSMDCAHHVPMYTIRWMTRDSHGSREMALFHHMALSPPRKQPRVDDKVNILPPMNRTPQNTTTWERIICLRDSCSLTEIQP